MESLRATSNIRPVRDVVQDLRVGVQHRVHEADWTLADGKTLLIDLEQQVNKRLSRRARLHERN
jgi:hypothetical protein